MDSMAVFFEKHRLAFIAFVSAIFILSTSSFAYAELKKDITISIENKPVKISTFRTTVGEVLADRNIQLKLGDSLNVREDEKLKDDLEIKIYRKDLTIPLVSRKLDPLEKDFARKIVAVKTSAPTVLEKSEVKNEKIAFGTQVIKNPKMEKGLTKVVKKGKPGVRKITYKVAYADGKVISRRVASVSVMKNPVNTITMQGTKNHISTSRGSKMIFTRAFVAEASAYWAGSCGKKKGSDGYGWTASGVKLKKGLVAVDPKVIPLGTWLYIEGYGVALAADTGSAIKGRNIDVAFDTEDQCMNFGRKNVKVYILDRPRFSF